MKLGDKQRKFAQMVGLLIIFIYSQGYEVTFGDAYAKTGHKKGSFHYKKLAIDLNLFKDGKYLRSTKAHKQFGEFWESIGGTWGGLFKRPDGNHYSYDEN